MLAVRQAEAVDVPLLRSVRLGALADSPEAFTSTLEREDAFTDEDWLVRLSPPSAAFFLTDSGWPVGLAGGLPQEDGSVEVLAMWVHPAARGRGGARLLIDAIAAWAGDRPLVLEVQPGNEVARRAYERCGFAVTGEHDGRLVMRRT